MFLVQPFISQIAFPAPQHNYKHYERTLLCRKDFTILYNNENQIPIIHCKSKKKNNTGFTILYSHGNAEDLSTSQYFIEQLAKETSCNVISYDYLGYSISNCLGVKPSEEGCYKSIDTVWKYATNSLNIPEHKIIIIGRSIGTGPSVDLASRYNQCAGVILISPLASGANVLSPGANVLGKNVVSSLISQLDIFKNYEKINKITQPIGIIHGKEDNIVSINNAYQLYNLIFKKIEPLWLDNYGHNNIPNTITFRYINNFISQLL